MSISYKNFKTKIANTCLSKNFVAIFVLAERLPTSATLDDDDDDTMSQCQRQRHRERDRHIETDLVNYLLIDVVEFFLKIAKIES